jgi:outer membrane lipoprotein-sorting protein
MTRFWFVLTLAGALSGAPKPQELTADQIVARHVEAMGGSAKLKDIQSLKIRARGTMGGQMEVNTVTYAKRPAMFRLEMQAMGREFVQAFDGAVGWRVNPLQGAVTPQQMDAAETKEIVANAEFNGALVDYKAKGHTIALLGSEEVAGRAAYKLLVARKSGKVTYSWLDAETFLILKNATTRVQSGKEIEVESYPGDFRKVEGVMFPFATESKSGGRPLMSVKVESVEVNPAIEDALFRRPSK